MRFRILGPLEVESSGQPVRISGHRQRKALALLLLNANLAVPIGSLVDGLWDEPPRSTRQQIHNVIGGLRRTLAAASREVSVVTTEVGYRMVLAPDSLDARRFQAAVRSADLAEESGRAEKAVRLLGEAVALWRGPALAGLDGRHLTSVAAGLNEQRLAAVERRMALRLALGETGSLVGDLTELVSEHPLRESLRHSLMLALHRSGRQADSLAVYEQGRRLLADELGLDPGRNLRRLHELMLADEPLDTGTGPHAGPDAGRARPPGGIRSADPGGPGTERTGPEHPAPCTLPHDTRDFTGRSAEIATLLAEGTDTLPTALAIFTIDGMGGVGKTALAVHVAHRLAGHHPGGQYYVDMRGFSAGLDPLTPAQALDILLRDCGTPADLIPTDLVGKSALWRSRTAGRRVLLVLDNVHGAAQVRPLLPGTAGVSVLITSRRRLTAVEGAVPVSLGVLPHTDAVALFTQIAGHDRTGAEPEAVDEAVGSCGRLPLAIRIAAARLRDRTSWRVADLVERLRTHARRTRVLTVDDRSVMAAITLSCRYLAPGHRRLFQLLSLHPGEDFDAAAAAVLAELPLDEAEQGVEALFEDNLLVRSTADRFGFHDLIRDCAYSLLTEHVDDAARRTAQHRLLDYYLHAARTWAKDLSMSALRFVPDITHVPEHVRAANSDDEAIALLGAEHRNITVLAQYAANHGWYTHAWQLPCALQPFLKLQNYGGDSLALFEGALHATRVLGDIRGESAVLTGLALLHRERGPNARARSLLERAIEISHELGDQHSEACQRANLGVVYANDNRLGDAHRNLLRAHELARDSADQRLYLAVVNNLGAVTQDLGQFDRALELFEYALSHLQNTGHRLPETIALWNVGLLCHLKGRHDEAAAIFDEVLAISRPHGFAQGEALALVGLCTVSRSLGKLTTALEYGRDAVSLARKYGLRELECEGLDTLGETLVSADDLTGAEATFAEARQFATRYGLLRYAARALEGFAHIWLARGDLAKARSQWEQALGMYPVGLVDAENPRRHLSALGVAGVLCARCAVADSPGAPDSGTALHGGQPRSGRNGATG